MQKVMLRCRVSSVSCANRNLGNLFGIISYMNVHIYFWWIKIRCGMHFAICYKLINVV
jgi:hypothetical protein